MILAGDIRKGVTFLYNNGIYVVVDFQHVKPGKGAAFVRTKLKNVVTGGVIEVTFNPSEKLEKAQIESKDMEYLYSDGDIYYFMDPETYEQVPLNKSQVEDALQYMTENMMATIKFYKGEAFSVEPPNFVTLLVTVCEPGAHSTTDTYHSSNTGSNLRIELSEPKEDVSLRHPFLSKTASAFSSTRNSSKTWNKK